ncbi:T9SS type A sorting domain-containing protein [Hymenobacter busanensis]|nr:T9SS type A sorting domain-containing protein [Hymenobacter busanensis]
MMLMALSARAQGQWDWAQRLPLVNTAVAAGPAGRVYVSGSFSGLVVIGGTRYAAVGTEDGFIGCFTSAGVLQWSQQLSSQPYYPQTQPQSASPTDIAADAAGNSYVTGAFTGRISFPNATVTAPMGWNGLFTAKYSPAGALQWIRAGGCPSYASKPGAIAVDAAGNSYIAGGVTSPAVFDQVSKSFAGKYQVFVASYSTTGAIRWLTTGSGQSNTNLAQDVAADGHGGVYVVGSYYSELTLGATVLPANSSNGTQYPNQLIAQLRGSTGQVVWARWAGGPGSYVLGEGISVDDAGNTCVAGRYSGAPAFGLGTNGLPAASSPTAYAAAYTSVGTPRWAVPLDLTTNQGRCRTASAADGSRCYVLSDRTTVSPTPVVLRRLWPASGSTQWRLDMRGDAHPYALTLAPDGYLFATGSVSGTAYFGPSMLNAASPANFFVRVSETAARQTATAAQNAWTAYPNPTQNLLRVPLPEPAQATVRDAFGQLRMQTLLHPQPDGAWLNVDRLLPGTYVLELRTAGGVVHRQWVVKE